MAAEQKKLINATKIINQLQGRIDNFIKKNPAKKDCESVQTVTEFIQLLENEPAAESEPEEKWIPCRERMPDKECAYLVTYNDDILGNYVKIQYMVDRKFKKEMGRKHNRTRVIAWQPLPKPYTEEKNSDRLTYGVTGIPFLIDNSPEGQRKALEKLCRYENLEDVIGESLEKFTKKAIEE